MSKTSDDKIRTMDMPVLDKVFGMEGGYVLDFSNRTFADFFREELRVNIDEPRWALRAGARRSACAIICDRRTERRRLIP